MMEYPETNGALKTLEPLAKEDFLKLPMAAKRRLKLSQLIQGTAMIAGLGLLGLVIYGYYLSFYPFKSAEAQHQPYIIVDKTLSSGDPIQYVVDICRYTDVQSTVTPQMIGERSINLPSYLSHLPTGCNKNTVANNFVPSYAPPGIYHLVLNIDYPVNPLQTIHKEFVTEDFEVTK